VISRKQFFQRIATPPTVKPSNSQRKISNAPPPSTANRTLSANSQVSSRSSFSTSSSSFKLTIEEEKGYDTIEAKKQASSSVITPSQPLSTTSRNQPKFSHEYRSSSTRRWWRWPQPQVKEKEEQEIWQ
jgi:hypothetical protein